MIKSCYLWPQRLAGYNCRDIRLAWQVLDGYFSRKWEYKAIKVREGITGMAKKNEGNIVLLWELVERKAGEFLIRRVAAYG